MNKITKNKKKNSRGYEEWMCTLCNHVFQGNYTRVWHHLLSLPADGVKGCSCGLDKRMEMTKLHMVATGVSEANLDSDRPFKVPRLTPSSTEMQGSTSERSKRSPSAAAEQIRKIYNVVHRDEADDAIADFFMANGISFNATRSPYYKEMVKKIIAAGPSYSPSGYNKMRISLLDKGVTRMQGLMGDLKQSWILLGCSIVMDGWTYIQQRPLLNIISHLHQGPTF